MDANLELRCLTLDISRASRQTTQKLVSEMGRIPLTVLSIAENAHQLTDGSIDAVKKLSPPQKELACREGCSWCCTFPVTVVAPEVFRISEYLRQNLSKTRYEEVKERVIRMDNHNRNKPWDQRLGYPCALLENNICIAYAVRPISCRGHNSVNVDECKKAAEGDKKAAIPTYEPQQHMANTIFSQVIDALQTDKLPYHKLDLSTALRIAMEVSEGLEKWIKGEDVFQVARKKGW